MKKIDKGVRFDALAVGDLFRFVGAPDIVCEKISARRAAVLTGDPDRARVPAVRAALYHEATEGFPVRLAQVVTPEVK